MVSVMLAAAATFNESTTLPNRCHHGLSIPCSVSLQRVVRFPFSRSVGPYVGLLFVVFLARFFQFSLGPFHYLFLECSSFSLQEYGDERCGIYFRARLQLEAKLANFKPPALFVTSGKARAGRAPYLF